MATIKYQVKENSAVGTHSFYAQAVSYSTLETSDLASEISEGMGISPHIVQMIIDRYAEVVERNVMRGHRVRLGNLLTFYPQISASVKDELDKDGKVVKKATADMLSIVGCKSSIGATVSQAVQQSFATGVSWKRIGDDAAAAKPTTPDKSGTDKTGTDKSDSSTSSSSSSTTGTTGTTGTTSSSSSAGGNNE